MISAPLLRSTSMNFLKRVFSRKFSCIANSNNCKILGIETSCDDTGSAVVTADRRILGESLKSHQEFMLQIGGIVPMVVQDLHAMCIKDVVDGSLANSNLTIHDVNAIAVTVKPGLALSLLVGMNYAKILSKTFQKPLIPVHHMEAHALTPRLIDESINYPFLALLISGGHCILTLVLSPEKFLVLGKCLDNGPGETFDKVARRLKLRNIPEYRNCNGGVAVESVAKKGNPLAFEFTPPLRLYKNCNFTFCGIKETIFRYINKEEEKYGTEGDQILPSINDLCASLQFAVTKHLCWRLQRAFDYIEQESLLPENNKTLIVSGGVACNNFIQNGISIICREKAYKLCVPPLKFCTDNGIMIAWNGVERYTNNIGIYNPDRLDEVDISPRCPLGEDITEKVELKQISCSWIPIHKLMGLI